MPLPTPLIYAGLGAIAGYLSRSPRIMKERERLITLEAIVQQTEQQLKDLVSRFQNGNLGASASLQSIADSIGAIGTTLTSLRSQLATKNSQTTEIELADELEGLQSAASQSEMIQVGLANLADALLAMGQTQPGDDIPATPENPNSGDTSGGDTFGEDTSGGDTSSGTDASGTDNSGTDNSGTDNSGIDVVSSGPTGDAQVDGSANTEVSAEATSEAAA